MTDTISIKPIQDVHNLLELLTPGANKEYTLTRIWNKNNPDENFYHARFILGDFDGNELFIEMKIDFSSTISFINFYKDETFNKISNNMKFYGNAFNITDTVSNRFKSNPELFNSNDYLDKDIELMLHNGSIVNFLYLLANGISGDTNVVNTVTSLLISSYNISAAAQYFKMPFPHTLNIATVINKIMINLITDDSILENLKNGFVKTVKIDTFINSGSAERYRDAGFELADFNSVDLLNPVRFPCPVPYHIQGRGSLVRLKEFYSEYIDSKVFANHILGYMKTDEFTDILETNRKGLPFPALVRYDSMTKKLVKKINEYKILFDFEKNEPRTELVSYVTKCIRVISYHYNFSLDYALNKLMKLIFKEYSYMLIEDKKFDVLSPEDFVENVLLDNNVQMQNLIRGLKFYKEPIGASYKDNFLDGTEELSNLTISYTKLTTEQIKFISMVNYEKQTFVCGLVKYKPPYSDKNIYELVLSGVDDSGSVRYIYNKGYGYVPTNVSDLLGKISELYKKNVTKLEAL